MNAIATKTVREVALENPVATRVFENLGIDYCCGGHQPLADACAGANLNVDDVLSRLEAAQNEADARGSSTRWQDATLTELVNHIMTTHHAYVQTESPRILQLMGKVVSKHGDNHPETRQVYQIFSDLAEELTSHMMKEERILFPYIVQTENHTQGGGSCFGSVQNPVRMMMLEHDNAGNLLRELRRLTSDYTVPADACTTYKTVYGALAEFEADLHQHIHLENNILFPRAIAMEESR